jgi:hypothetical protein
MRAAGAKQELLEASIATSIASLGQSLVRCEAGLGAKQELDASIVALDRGETSSEAPAAAAKYAEQHAEQHGDHHADKHADDSDEEDYDRPESLYSLCVERILHPRHAKQARASAALDAVMPHSSGLTRRDSIRAPCTHPQSCALLCARTSACTHHSCP